MLRCVVMRLVCAVLLKVRCRCDVFCLRWVVLVLCCVVLCRVVSSLRCVVLRCSESYDVTF